MEDIRIQYRPDVKDHIKAVKLYYSKSILTKLDKVAGLLVLGCGAFLLISYAFSWWYLLLIIIGIIGLFGFFQLDHLIVRMRFHQDPKLKENYTLEFGEEGIGFKTPTIDSRLTWTHYHKLMENDDIILLIYGQKMYTVVPKQAFKDSEEINRFRELANKMIAKNKT